ncbi:MAG: metallophosphoesterase family protein [Nitrospinota bacterium]|jgi:hypothetical protein|nr:metallophosphoesterase family protein [Nitrospinota bacterium]MDP7503886.1 metallophosphoesterase family protein [Nitrospinota bacterium]
MSADSFRLMILSDTHGQLPREVARACEGADHIIHAGDVGGDGILPELESMAPVTVVCGNVDRADLAPVRARLRLGGWRILVQHIVWRGGGPSGEVREPSLGRGSRSRGLRPHPRAPLPPRGRDGFMQPGELWAGALFFASVLCGGCLERG